MSDTLDDRLEEWPTRKSPATEAEVQRLVDEIVRLREQNTALGARVQEAWKRIDELEEAVAPFVAYYRVSTASRNPDMPDTLGVATHTNTIDGDTSITVGDLRRADAAFRGPDA